MTSEQLNRAAQELQLSPGQMARALAVPVETFEAWASGNQPLPPVAARCVELLLLYPDTAKRLAARPPKSPEL